MARAQLSSVLSGISGNIGGINFRHGNGNTIIGKARNGRKSLKAFGSFVANNFTSVARYWRELTDAQRATWQTQAPNYPYTDTFGRVKSYTGYQLFCKVNMFRTLYGFAVLTDLPAPVYVTACSIDSMTADATNSQLLITLFPDDAGNVPANTLYVIQSVAPGSTGRYRPDAQPWRNLQIFNAGSSVSGDLWSEWVSLFGEASAAIGTQVVLRSYSISLLTGQVTQYAINAETWQ